MNATELISACAMIIVTPRITLTMNGP
jgi:hypothetical protein